jgi:hypothetical protein
MNEESNANRKTNGNANLPVDTSAFIRQVSYAGNREYLPEVMQAEVSNEMPEPAEEKPAKRKRGQAVDYEGLFLSRNELRDRQGLYIGKENYEILQTLVRGERLSVSGLVDNIVSAILNSTATRLTVSMTKTAGNP